MNLDVFGHVIVHYQNTEISPARLLIEATIAAHANADRECDPGVKRLAKLTHTSESTVKRVIAELCEEPDWVVIQHGGERRNEEGRCSNKYIVPERLIPPKPRNVSPLRPRRVFEPGGGMLGVKMTPEVNCIGIERDFNKKINTNRVPLGVNLTPNIQKASTGRKCENCGNLFSPLPLAVEQTTCSQQCTHEMVLNHG